MRDCWIIGLAAALLMGAHALPARGESCDDFDPCTKQDMCSDGTCAGIPVTSGSCDDGDECTVNDHCSAQGCTGDPAPVNTACGGGCGTCQSLTPFPIPGVPLSCAAKDGAQTGDSCDASQYGNCLDGACQIVATGGGLPSLAFCVPALKVCPDTDGNPCTDNCNFANGKCEKNAPKCLPTCETCNAGTGQCEPTNEGGACDDGDACTPASRCETTSIGDQQRGLCMAGEPSGPTPTATSGSGATPTPTQPTSTGCVGDCNGDELVAVNELVTGVNIALGNADIEVCPSFDTNHDRTVAVNELIGGVNAALNGCS
jgi:hypothetical protein